MADITGLNLRIDENIQKVCEASNSSSGTTRTILYVTVLCSILSLFATLNTRHNNWAEIRIHSTEDSIVFYKRILFCDSVRDKKNASYDSLLMSKHVVTLTKLNIFEERYRNLVRNARENYSTVRIPFIANAFDVDDLALISGITFTLLLFIARVTLKREVNNLTIALISISNRYPHDANPKDFEDCLEDLSKINKVRREHHYNYLSMNELFTFPPLAFVEEIQNKKSLSITKVSNYIFWLPPVIILAIGINDLLTVEYAWALSKPNTIISFMFTILSILSTSYLSFKCTINKKKMIFLYGSFYANQYMYSYEEVKSYMSMPSIKQFIASVTED